MSQIGADLDFLKTILQKLELQSNDLKTSMDPVGGLIGGMTALQSNFESRGSQLDNVTSVLGGLLG